MKLEKLIKGLFFTLMVGIWVLIILFIVNTLCGKCIHKDLDKILNVQGYAFDVKHNEVKPYCENNECDKCEKPKFAKQRFNKSQTTGFMTLAPVIEDTSCRSCN